MTAYLDSWQAIIPPSTPERDLRDLNRVVMYTKTLLRTPEFQPTLERWAVQVKLLDFFTQGALREPTKGLVEYLDRMDDPPTPRQLSEFIAMFDPWRDQSRDPLRVAALAFLLKYKIPPIALIDVATAALQDIALSHLSGITFAVQAPVSMTIFPNVIYKLPNGDLISDRPRSRISLRKLLRQYPPDVRAQLLSVLQPAKASGRPPVDLRGDVVWYLRMQLLSHKAYQIAAESGLEHVDTNPVVRAHKRVLRLLSIPKVGSI